MNLFKNYSFFIFFFLTIIFGIIIFSPYTNFQYYLAQGDHGRELYAFEAVLRGEIPYKDFWWDYGPLMTYYYAIFFKILGIQIPSILFGKILLNIACGVFCYLAISEILFPAAAFVASLWLMCFQQDFLYTYNHIGGIALIFACIWMHFAYIRHSRIGSAYTALGLVFLLGLVKVNFGVIALLMTILTVNVFDRIHLIPFNKEKQLFYMTALFLPLIWMIIYYCMTYGLTLVDILECFPYFKGYETHHYPSFKQTIPPLYNQYLNPIHTNHMLYVVALIIFICLLRNILILFINKNNSLKKTEELFLVIYAALFYLLNLHEYLLSGLLYRSYWSQPLGILLCALIIIIALKESPVFFKWMIWIFFIIVCLLHIKQNTNEIRAFKTPEHFLNLPKTNVYTRNDLNWFQTVKQTTSFINRTLKKEDLFFALPYDCLYYYLTNKRSPTRQLIFFERFRIPKEQEQEVISELLHKHVKMVLISSRQSTKLPGCGIFGKTYCPTLYHFIAEKYYPIAQFGEWKRPSEWIFNHGTILLKLKDQ